MVRCFLKVPLEGPRHLLGTVGLGSQLIPILTVLGVLQFCKDLPKLVFAHEVHRLTWHSRTADMLTFRLQKVFDSCDPFVRFVHFFWVCDFTLYICQVS